MKNVQEEALNPETAFPSGCLLEPTDHKVIDYAVLAQLKADISESFFPELLKVFLDQGIQRADRIEQAIDENDFSSLSREIHSFNGESATFGAVKLSELTGHINLLCNQGKQGQAFASAKAIKSHWLLVCSELQKL